MTQKPKILIIVVIVILVLAIGVMYTSHRANSHDAAQGTVNSNQTSFFETGDTNTEVLRTVVAKQNKLEAENEQLQAQNQDLEKQSETSQNTKMQQMSIDLTSEIDTLKSQIEQLKESSLAPPTHPEQTINTYNINDASAAPVNPISNQNNVISEVQDLAQSLAPLPPKNNTGNLAPQNTNLITNTGPSLPSDQDTMPVPTSNASSTVSNTQKILSIPYYTIPEHSTLNNVVLMSSIIAEVPVSGQLVEPSYPFKAIIGRRDLFAANGMTLPDDLAGIVLEGYAVGNMTMSCARPYVTGLLFVFNDGHFESYPAKGTEADATQLFPKQALGYLSDTKGNVCLPGQYISDAKAVIANLALLGGVANTGNAYAQAQLSVLQNAFQSTSVSINNVGKYVLGSTIGGASQQALQWYTNRVADIYDVVFIPASNHFTPTNVVFNVTQTIPIDLDKTGRKIDENLASGPNSNNELD